MVKIIPVTVCLVFVTCKFVFSLPVIVKPNATATEKKPYVHEGPEIKDDDFQLKIGEEFSRYLKEVASTLEQDEHMQNVMSNMTDEELQSGKFAHHLDNAHEMTRRKLDELKRMELESLKSAIKKKQRVEANHVDLRNPHSFEVDDLKKLIESLESKIKKIETLEDADYKKYEMEQKLKHKVELKHMTEEQRKKALEEDKKHELEIDDDFKHVKHPGTKHQLEDTWKELGQDVDSMDPRTLFKFLDTNGDNVLEIDEVRAMLVPEVHALTHLNQTEKDFELLKMEEHFMRQYDKNHDMLIDANEWEAMTHDSEYDKDDGWKREDPYTDEDYGRFEKEHEQDFESFYAYDHPDEANPGYEHIPDLQHPSVGNEHPQVVPLGQHQQVPQYQQQYQQVQQQQQHYQQLPQHQQVPQHQQQNQQVPHHQQQNQQVPQHQQQAQQQQNQQAQLNQQTQNKVVPQQQQQQQQQQQNVRKQ